MSAKSPSMRAAPRSSASLRLIRFMPALAGARNEVDHVLARVLDRGLEQRHGRCRGGREADREHDPVDEAVAALLAANALGGLEEPEEERVDHGGHLLHGLDGLGEKAKE